ncbi:MAG: hypothetical protein MRZ57_05385, partial [Bacteroidales bacterium]|nr:hypothetical protein [Bacteroidales bacterium]
MEQTAQMFHAFFVSFNRFLLRIRLIIYMSVMKQQHTIDDTCLPLPEKGAKEGENNPSTGLTPDALPEVPQPVLAENSQTGVSTKNAQPVTDVKTPLKTIKRKPKEVPHWYALRVTYGR